MPIYLWIAIVGIAIVAIIVLARSPRRRLLESLDSTEPTEAEECEIGVSIGGSPPMSADRAYPGEAIPPVLKSKTKPRR